jgi:hypothetical protein
MLDGKTDSTSADLQLTDSSANCEASDIEANQGDHDMMDDSP